MERYTSIKQSTKGLFIMCGDFSKATFTSLCFASVQLDLVISHREVSHSTLLGYTTHYRQS